MFDLQNLVSRKGDYETVFNSPAGRKVLADLIKFAKVLEPTYVPQDPETTAYNEGMRRVVLRIISILEKDPAKQYEKIFNISKDLNNE